MNPELHESTTYLTSRLRTRTEKPITEKWEEAIKICGDTELNTDQARIIFDKLKRKYKLHILQLEFTGRMTRHLGLCYGQTRIQLRWKTNLRTLCHEIAHAIEHKKYGRRKHQRHHGKRFYRLKRSVCLYAVKCGLWKDELSRRLTPKPFKAPPTKHELRLSKLQKRKDDLARYQKELNYWTKLYTNKMKKAKRSISALEKALATGQPQRGYLNKNLQGLPDGSHRNNLENMPTLQEGQELSCSGFKKEIIDSL